jgi:nicotinate-nucleotide pyrophosphorylase (carboxylating)
MAENDGSRSRQYLRRLIDQALEEDVGSGDVTTQAVLNGSETGRARAVAKENLVVAGIDVFQEVFHVVDEGISIALSRHNGEEAAKGDVLAEVTGSLAGILVAERVALNFLQRMCGIATLTRRYVAAVQGTKAQILDTRKTVPGLRLLDKMAVRMGGGRNHRFGLYDAVLIKDNHITAAGGIGEAVARVHARYSATMTVEVETRNRHDVAEAIRAGADVIMLDNMGMEEMREAVALVGGRVPLEASGNVTLATVGEIARTGVDFISVGALTHSVPAADITLLIEEKSDGRWNLPSKL